MTYKLLETVVLRRDLPQYGLCQGDLGAVVQVCGSVDLEVEFVTAAGKTRAVATLTTDDVRPVSDSDLISVRSTTNGA